MSDIKHPEIPVARKHLQSILFLADRMSEADGSVCARERRIIETLAEAAGMKDFRADKDYRAMSDYKACNNLDVEAAKDAALIVISLVLKADFERDDAEQEYFTRIRKMLEADPITVPVELEAHKQLALEYLS